MLMTYSIDGNGHLDLSPCYRGLGCDMMLAAEISHQFFFAELQNLVAWDGLPVRGMGSEAKWRHLVCKHGKDGLPMNPLTDLELERVKRLPVLKEVVGGRLPIDLYAQYNRRGTVDKVELVVDGPEADYLVSLGFFETYYVLRSAYHAGASYARRVRERGTYCGSIGRS
ncbi:MAG: hypothetical protein EGQ03_04740 [Collinsella aerofaciens]|nr:hypothetical protein [Collinsella aerofaciens]